MGPPKAFLTESEISTGPGINSLMWGILGVIRGIIFMRKLILLCVAIAGSGWWSHSQISSKGGTDASGSLQTTSDDQGHLDRPSSSSADEPVAKAEPVARATAVAPGDASSSSQPAQAPGPTVSEIIKNAARTSPSLQILMRIRIPPGIQRSPGLAREEICAAKTTTMMTMTRKTNRLRMPRR